MENPPVPSYSPFWPLQILVVIIAVWLGYHVITLNQARLVAIDNIQQVTPGAEASLAAKKKLFGLAQEILELSSKSAAAAQIVNEFQIRPATAPAKSPEKK